MYINVSSSFLSLKSLFNITEYSRLQRSIVVKCLKDTDFTTTYPKKWHNRKFYLESVEAWEPELFLEEKLSENQRRMLMLLMGKKYSQCSF